MSVIAQVALGQWRHVEQVLRGSPAAAPVAGSARAGALRMVELPPNATQENVWHRDGWMFQVISWIASVEASAGPTRPPHIRHADKGFDGLQLVLSKDGTRLKRLILFEDKATSNPRKTVRDKVWPEFREMESGARDHELLSELSALLMHAPQIDEVQAVNRVMRSTTHRSYRVAVTVGSTQASVASIRTLFKGFADVVSGRRRRRHGHVLQVDDLRDWMSSLAAKVACKLREEPDV